VGAVVTLPLDLELLPVGCGSGARYVPGVIEPSEADGMLAELLAAPIWSRPDITMFGRTSRLPRQVAWFGDKRYAYSRISTEPLGWTPLLLRMRNIARDLTGTDFDSALANRYDDGQATVAWHADDEPIFDTGGTIVGLSLGATRRFKLKHRDTGEVVEQRLDHGSALVMTGRCQCDWVHSVPREARVTEPRINLTFRRLAS
jgi:alkylated DNA repair dioxygenase AlkB